jgi:hypothetical protein
MDWFEQLFGFVEGDYESVREQLEVRGNRLRSRANGRFYGIGRLETPSLGELRERATGPESNAPVRVSNIIGDAGQLHAEAKNAGCLFQVASQFNLLEMIGPGRVPEDGVTGYVGDPTQGPACAVAAGAGAVYRNYFAPVGSRKGQTSEHQIDCLRDVHDCLSPDGKPLWEMRNGYALCSQEGLEQINSHLSLIDETGRDAVRSRLRIGLHWDVQVTRPDPAHEVSQAYCSALPVAYSALPSADWELFARTVLEATYEACLLAARENMARTGNRVVYLTMVGGGAFGNEADWIIDAMRRAIDLLPGTGLDVRIVHHWEVHQGCIALERN